MTETSHSGGSFSHPQMKDGYFVHQNAPFFPIGFNYWPSRTGVQAWNQFRIQEWEEDFCEIQRRGFNTVRLFLLWPEFQPSETTVDQTFLKRLREVADMAAREKLWIMPTLFQGFMSGVNFDPTWRAGRNHICDQSLRPAMVLFVRSVCQALRECKNILALDLANEIDVICPNVDSTSLRSWTADLREAARSVMPDLLVTNGVSTHPIVADQSWTLADQELDFHAMHGYPMFWTPLPVLSLRSARSSLLFGGTTAFAKAHGPVMRQEYGSAMGGDGDLVLGFIRASSFASFLAGSNGFLYWCWRDFVNMADPYRHCPFESSMGYVDPALQPKEWARGMDDFKEFLALHEGWSPVPDPVGIYIPEEFKRGKAANDAALAFTYENLVANGYLPRFVTTIDSGCKLIVVPLGILTLNEIADLAAFCQNGGRVIVLGLNSKTCGRSWEEFTGTRQMDILRVLSPLQIPIGKGLMDIGITGAQEMLPTPVLEPVRERVDVWLEWKGVPLGFVADHGKGKVLQFVPSLTGEKTADINEGISDFWRNMLSLVDFEPAWKTTSPYLQVGELVKDGEESKLLIINHMANPVQATVRGKGRSFSIDISGKTAVWKSLKTDLKPVEILTGAAS